jgi:hypothetical protein
MPTGGWLGCNNTVVLGPAQRWPLGVMVSAPPTLVLYQRWITSEVSMPSRVWWLVEAAIVLCILLHRVSCDWPC